METILLTCGYCGAKLEPDAQALQTGICKCNYCCSSVIIPKDHSKIERWFNRAVFLRQNGDFDKAIRAYEHILTEDNEDPEAHWGLALSKHGIEYVDDAKTGEKIPVCHRTMEQTILADPEYREAVRFASADVAAVIESEANRIHITQKKILEISKQEPPYDVFISYKELDEQNERTRDSVIAQDLYNELVKKGYKVFFARKTLEGKLGMEYEPIIYAALTSAKVMVVLGTRPEHFNAVWVRNEWRRFQLMSTGMEKTLIPAYRDMFPDELPVELSSLTALDISRIGFMQELIDGIDRCVGKKRNEGKEQATDESILRKGANRLHQIAETYLTLGNLESAKNAFQTMTQDYPEDFRGWWGLIICHTGNFKKETISSQALAEINAWFGYVQKLVEQENFSALQKQLADYYNLLAGTQAKTEIEGVNAKIQAYKEDIEKHESAAKSCRFGEPIIAKYSKDSVKRKKAEISSAKSRIKFNRELLIPSVADLFSPVDYMQSVKNNHDQKQREKEKISKYRNEISSASVDLQNLLVENQKWASDHDNMAGTLREYIETCERYLGLGKNQIEELNKAQLCAGIGVICDVDPAADLLRKEVASLPESHPDWMTSTCRQCHKTYWSDRNFVQKYFSAPCPFCGK